MIVNFVNTSSPYLNTAWKGNRGLYGCEVREIFEGIGDFSKEYTGDIRFYRILMVLLNLSSPLVSIGLIIELKIVSQR